MRPETYGSVPYKSGMASTVTSERLELRLASDQEQDIEQAAAISGRSVTDFSVPLLVEEAGEVIRQERELKMSKHALDAVEPSSQYAPTDSRDTHWATGGRHEIPRDGSWCLTAPRGYSQGSGGPRIVGARALVVHAISVIAEQFYPKFGFTLVPDSARVMYITMADAEATIADLAPSVLCGGECPGAT